MFNMYVQQLEFNKLDFFTVRDWLRLSGCGADLWASDIGKYYVQNKLTGTIQELKDGQNILIFRDDLHTTYEVLN